MSRFFEEIDRLAEELHRPAEERFNRWKEDVEEELESLDYRNREEIMEEQPRDRVIAKPADGQTVGTRPPLVEIKDHQAATDLHLERAHKAVSALARALLGDDCDVPTHEPTPQGEAAAGELPRLAEACRQDSLRSRRLRQRIMKLADQLGVELADA